jgi:4-hydroxy 2-oxovalerate aldolase
MRHRFTEEQVRSVVRALDDAGVEVREVSHGDGPGGSSFNYGFSGTDEMKLTAAAVDEAVRARIAVLLLPGVGTVHELKRAYDAGARVARVSSSSRSASEARRISDAKSSRPATGCTAAGRLAVPMVNRVGVKGSSTRR